MGITFGRSQIRLLGDAPAAPWDLSYAEPGFSVLKLAHHGSSRGLADSWGAINPEAPRDGTRYAIITPYRRGLPAGASKSKLLRAGAKLIQTPAVASRPPRHPVPAQVNARVSSDEVHWYGITLSASGEINTLG